MSVKYDYSSPENSINSLELAYSNEDISQVFLSKDFETEAKIVLKKANLEISNEMIFETAELLRLSLIKHIQENGFPYFGDLNISFSEVEEIEGSLFKLKETIIDVNGQTSINDIYLSHNADIWKVVMVEEIFNSSTHKT